MSTLYIKLSLKAREVQAAPCCSGAAVPHSGTWHTLTITHVNNSSIKMLFVKENPQTASQRNGVVKGYFRFPSYSYSQSSSLKWVVRVGVVHKVFCCCYFVFLTESVPLLEFKIH